jgi:hypothetical protein
MTIESILWRRIDVPGHDACRLEQDEDGWRLNGVAVFRQDHLPARLEYHLTCDLAWRSRGGAVRGWVAGRNYEINVNRTASGVWTLNGENASDLTGCLDLDFGFTPATNLAQLCRVALDIGQAADVPVAWLDVTAETMTLLDQRYERRSIDTYWYEAPRFDYAALLETRPPGFVRRYPGLWEEDH